MTSSVFDKDSSSLRRANGAPAIFAGANLAGSVFGSSFRSSSHPNGFVLVAALKRESRRSGAIALESSSKLGCTNRERRRGTSETMVSDPANKTPVPRGNASPFAVGAGTPSKSRAAARFIFRASAFTSPLEESRACVFASTPRTVADPRPAAPSHSFTGTPAAAMASTMPVRLSVGGVTAGGVPRESRALSALRAAASSATITSDVAHSSSSTCTRVGSDGAGGFARSRLLSAAAVSSLAAPPAPAAASSGRISAGASITGKCLAMNRAASGRAADRAPADDGSVVALKPVPSANPAGRKYPSAGLVGAPVPRLRNRPGTCSTRALYRGRTYSADAGWPPAKRESAEATVAARSSTTFEPSTTRFPSASSAGGGGKPSDADRGHNP